MTSNREFDFAIIGGGVIGLSIAWQLARDNDNSRIVVVERNRVGREASWAGAGILPPSSVEKARHPGERLAAESFRLHAEWSSSLKNETGIDTGFRKCGAVFVARTAGEVAALAGQITEWQESDVLVRKIDHDELLALVPNLASRITKIRAAALVPDEVQIRNPDHLRAMVAACRKQGVTILEEQGNSQIETGSDSCNANRLVTESGRTITAAKYCVSAGAWSQSLMEQLGVKISTLPVRGQMLLYKLPQQTFKPIVYEGTRYIVSRDDGHVLVGSTLEEAGFDKSTTIDAIDELKQFAASILSELNDLVLVDSWAGLRPATYDGFPYLGRVPGIENMWVATGHFRAGLLLSTGTAVLMSQLMTDREPMFDLSPFRIDRG